jgi:peptidoglycan hydrolase CwlO-like protein
MTLKVKVIIGVIIVFVLMGVVAYVANSWGEKALAKAKQALQAAQSKVDELNGQVTSLNGYWANKEEEYRGRIASLIFSQHLPKPRLLPQQ